MRFLTSLALFLLPLTALAEEPALVTWGLGQLETDDCPKGSVSYPADGKDMIWFGANLDGDGDTDYILMACHLTCSPHWFRITNGFPCASNIALLSGDGEPQIKDSFDGVPLARVAWKNGRDAIIAETRNFGGACGTQQAASQEEYPYTCVQATRWTGDQFEQLAIGSTQEEVRQALKSQP